MKNIFDYDAYPGMIMKMKVCPERNTPSGVEEQFSCPRPPLRNVLLSARFSERQQVSQVSENTVGNTGWSTALGGRWSNLNSDLIISSDSIMIVVRSRCVDKLLWCDRLTGISRALFRPAIASVIYTEASEYNCRFHVYETEMPGNFRRRQNRMLFE